MKTRAKALIGYKVFFALLGFSAIVTELAVVIERGSFNAVNFFSFFTIQTNILIFVTLLLSALATAYGKPQRWMDILRAASTVYILVVGIGFAILLSGLEGVALTAVPWDNTVLHYIIPIAVLIDYLIDRPSRKISFKTGIVWVAFPLLYVVYSLVRGSIVGWYPYPFLNPVSSSYGSVAVAVAGLLVLGIVLIAIVTWLSRQRTKTAR